MTAEKPRWTVRLAAAAEADFQDILEWRVEVLRILHDAMDLRRHIQEEEHES